MAVPLPKQRPVFNMSSRMRSCSRSLTSLPRHTRNVSSLVLPTRLDITPSCSFMIPLALQRLVLDRDFTESSFRRLSWWGFSEPSLVDLLSPSRIASQRGSAKNQAKLEHNANRCSGALCRASRYRPSPTGEGLETRPASRPSLSRSIARLARSHGPEGARERYQAT